MLTNIIDGFMDGFDELRSHAITRNYRGEVNPADGVFYPGISTDVPKRFQKQIEEKLGADIKLIFFRLSVFGVDAPHQAHNDAIMAENTAILYINSGGGTAIVNHKYIDMLYGPCDDEELDVWKRDVNNYTAWEIVDFCAGVPNRLVHYPSALMHRAEPVCGFGSSPENGRLVMVVFYD